MSVTVFPVEHGDLSVLSEALRENPALLARSGRAEDVELLDLNTSSAALYANLIDLSAGGPEGVSARHWKAALDVAGRGIVISVFGKRGGPVPGAGGERLARDAAQAMLDVNVDTAPPQETSP
ncbi:MAG: hypothetical protein AAGA15_05715 [Pseudomonadota bacterium]